MGSYQKAPQKGITKLQYLLRGSFVLLLFQLTIAD
ncbi:transposase [Streptococcus pneumoniae]|nr:transposase [Streptococcus pneumoniae]